MNIFATSDDPVQSAYDLDDKRVVKMVLETAQMLSTALRVHGIETGPHYKAAYIKHPCTIWACATRANYAWLTEHGLALSEAYSSVYGKKHASHDIIMFAQSMTKSIKRGQLQEFADCTEFKHRDDISVIKRYRMFMKLKWNRDIREPTWQGRLEPLWRVMK